MILRFIVLHADTLDFESIALQNLCIQILGNKITISVT